jgi:hypothetical protein
MAVREDMTVRFLEAIGDGDVTEVFRVAAQSDALAWMRRTLTFGAGLGLSPEASTPVIVEALDTIRAVAIARAERPS